MKIDLNFNLSGLDGVEIPGECAGKLLAQALAGSNVENPVKVFDWCLKLWNGEPINLDDSDRIFLRHLIVENKTLTVLSKGQILKKING